MNDDSATITLEQAIKFAQLVTIFGTPPKIDEQQCSEHELVATWEGTTANKIDVFVDHAANWCFGLHKGKEYTWVSQYSFSGSQEQVPTAEDISTMLQLLES